MPIDTHAAGAADEKGAALATLQDHLRSFASNTKISGARVRLDLTEAPYYGSSTCSAEVTRAIGDAVAASLATESPAPGALADLRKESSFLLDRLTDFEVVGVTAEGIRDWYGHVTPSMARLRTLIASSPAASAPPVDGETAGGVKHDRAAFEKWISGYGFPSRFSHRGCYENSHTVMAWNAWQASLKHTILDTAAPEQAGSRGWTLQSIAAWCEETFGPIHPARIVSRAAEEMDELRAEPTRVEEAADVVIVLARYPGLWDEIQRKMEVNRNRRWRLMGDGTGYHIKDEPPAAARPHSDAEGRS